MKVENLRTGMATRGPYIRVELLNHENNYDGTLFIFVKT